MQESETLSAMAHLATKHWKGSHYSDSKKWGRLDKYFRRATYGTTSKFNIMQQVSFRIPLVKKSGGNFYYDAKGELGGLNLYSGKKPKTKQEREENQAFPLKNYTEEELIALFLRQVQKKRLYSDIRSGRIAFVGLSIEVDENSLYHSRIPTARVVLVVGARRMRNVPGKFQQVSLTEETSESSAQE